MSKIADLVLEALRCGVVVHAPDGRAVLANPEAGALLGIEPAAIAGRRPSEYLAADPEAARALEARLAAVGREGGGAGGGGRHCISLGAGRTRRTLCDVILRLRDPESGAVYLALVLDDVSDFKAEIGAHEDELEALRALQVHSEKMAALGDLLAGVAHEINTPLGALNANHDVFVRSVPKLREAAVRLEGEPRAAIERLLGLFDDLNRVNAEAIGRMLRLVGGLRNFARREEPLPEDVNLHDRIDDSLTLVHHQIRNRIEIVREYGAGVPPISCYSSLLNQVLLNILVNAVHAIEGKGRITIRTARTGSEVRIDITDTGRGIPPEIRDRIFEPGFTTKGRGRGTGLGLSISRQIVERHCGRIEFESEVGKGTTFSIILPLTCAGEAAPGTPSREEGE